MAHVDTQAIPALDAWKKVQQNRVEAVERVYNSIRKSISNELYLCKTSLTFSHSTFDWQFERVGVWPFGKFVPCGDTKQIFERLENDGFTVTWKLVDFSWYVNVSWDFSGEK